MDQTFHAIVNHHAYFLLVLVNLLSRFSHYQLKNQQTMIQQPP